MEHGIEYLVLAKCTGGNVPSVGMKWEGFGSSKVVSPAVLCGRQRSVSRRVACSSPTMTVKPCAISRIEAKPSDESWPLVAHMKSSSKCAVSSWILTDLSRLRLLSSGVRDHSIPTTCLYDTLTDVREVVVGDAQDVFQTVA